MMCIPGTKKQWLQTILSVLKTLETLGATCHLDPVRSFLFFSIEALRWWFLEKIKRAKNHAYL